MTTVTDTNVESTPETTATSASTAATFVTVRADECSQEVVELNMAGVKIPGVKFISPDKRRFASVPKFFLDAIDWIKANKADGMMMKEDFQAKMREIAINDYGFPASKDKQYYARWSEMSTLGYRQNPGWIAWLQPVQVERNRFYKVFENGEAPMSATMLTREHSPFFGQAKEGAPKRVAKSTQIAELQAQLAAQTAQINALMSRVGAVETTTAEAIAPKDKKKK
jgi:tRNA(Leu) C34 or U34 (ribose-2'-O)-methylase TrmL